MKKSWQIQKEVVSLLEVLAAKQSEVGQRIETLRRAHGLSQEAAAHEVGVTSRQWQRWASGESEPRASNLARISERFDVPASELIGAAAGEPKQLDRIERRLEDLDAKLDQIINLMRLEPDQVAMEIHRAFDDMASRLGREVGKRGPVSAREYRRTEQEAPAA